MAILNINGYYDSLIVLVQTMVDQGFVKTVNQQMLLISDNVEELLEKMKNYVPPQIGQVISQEKV